MASSIHWQELTPQPASAAGEPARQTAAAGNAVSRDTFLRLLVAQIRNQNPLSPADGIEFLTQLAQFTELEQLIGMRQELEAIRGSLAGATGTSADETRAGDGR